ncbi:MULTISPECIES: SBBP repeat-containing protein, partial [unclassified Microcoleus]
MNAQNQQSSYGQIPLSFIANSGQTDPSVKFQVKGAGHSIFFSPNEISFTAFSTPTEPGNPATATSSTVRSSLADSNPNPTISGLEQLPGVANFLLGEDSSQWHRNVPTFNGVVYHNVYQGIDRVFKGTEGQLKSEFLVAPLADPSQIRMNYSGVSDIRLRDDGALILETPLGELIDNAPIVYQDINGTRVNVTAAYNLLGNGQVGFSLGDFDRTQPLVIDPVLAYSTYLGGSGSDSANRMTVDSTGAAYIIGTTVNNFTTTPGAFQTTPGGQADFLVTKINPEGTALVYSTYIGGPNNEYGHGIAVDTQGNAYLTGQVDPGYPTTPGAFQPTAPNYTAAVTKLNAAGNALVYSTFLGKSTSGALGNGIAVDSNGNAYVTGITGDGFPTTANASQPTYRGGIDAFITKVNPTGSALVYSTYFGGSAREGAQAIALDNNGNAYVTGNTYSTDLPVSYYPADTLIGGQSDAFVSKFDANGARTYSTYLGGSGDDLGNNIAVDSSGNAYVVGNTASTDFPTVSPIQDTNAGGANDAFVSKLSPNGTSLIYSTYLGGSGDDNGNRIAVDSAGNVYVAGNTTSTNFPTKNAIQSVSGGGKDAFVTKINSSGSALVDSTYLGGSGDDYGNGIGVDANGAVYVAGATKSTNFPTANPLQAANGGGDFDVFITKLIPGGPQVKIVESGGSTNVAESGTTDTYTVVLTNQPTANVAIALNTATQIQPIAGLSFTPTNWFLPQTVTVSAVDDPVIETSPHSGTIAHSAISTDANYNGATASFTVNGTAGNAVNANITDNDIAGVTITPATTTATEGGATGSYTVKLNTQPTAPVTINVATGSQIKPITALTFTTTNWNVAQTVAVAAVDDNLVEGNHTGAIAHTATSTDAKYNGITIGGVNVAITDNDTAGFSVAPTNITATEGGATGSYKIKLTSQPIAPVNISFNTGNQISPIATPI